MKIELKILNKEFYSNANYSNKNTDLDKPINYFAIPEYATLGSAGMDLRITKDVTLYPGECQMVGIGLAMHIGSRVNDLRFCLSPLHCPELTVAALVLPRSGLGHKGLILGNTLGLIDDDFTGELGISLWNRNTPIPNNPLYGDTKLTPFQRTGSIYLKAGERVAQLVFISVIKAEWQIVGEFSKSTERGNGGFGSTGK